MVRNFLTTVAAGLVLATIATVVVPSPALAGPPKGPHYVPAYVYGYHHHYFPHYGYGNLYVGPAIVLPATAIAVSATPHTLFCIGTDGQTRVYGTYMQTVYSNGATQMGGLVEAQAALTAAGITNWIDAPQPAAAN
jgi:hypothetical protein